MPSLAPDGSRPTTAVHIVHVDGGPGVFAGDAAGIARMTAALLAGATEVRTTDPATARRVRAVVDRLLVARETL